mmetsp:Transcript_30399/g.90688  ORF Transcript_30399/g.90688 Transcript_30399/m.90688 type:complete len:137 (+) Transcript_30399:4213-4623(+)
MVREEDRARRRERVGRRRGRRRDDDGRKSEDANAARRGFYKGVMMMTRGVLARERERVFKCFHHFGRGLPNCEIVSSESRRRSTSREIKRQRRVEPSSTGNRTNGTFRRAFPIVLKFTSKRERAVDLLLLRRSFLC